MIIGFTINMKTHLTNIHKVHEIVTEDFHAIHRYLNMLISQLISQNL